MSTYGSVAADNLTSSTGQSLSPASSSATMKNRIINGGMVIDQRNNGASVTPVTGTAYFGVDRFTFNISQSSKFSSQQNAGSVTPPSGFTNYLGITSLSAYSVLSTDYFQLVQRIEGYNVADLGWGTVNAKTITVSFWVYSSLTGTFAGAIRNIPTYNRTYVFNYSIPVANTWTQISVTIAGDTTGTWGQTNGGGLELVYSLGAGSSVSGTSGTWVSGQYFSATGTTSVVGTSGATFYITGVQLEVGTVASSFDYRVYSHELAMCQRYYERLIAPTNSSYATIAASSSSQARGDVRCLVTKRAIPSVNFAPASQFLLQIAGNNFFVSSFSVANYSLFGFYLQANSPNTLTPGQGGSFIDGANASYIEINAEL